MVVVVHRFSPVENKTVKSLSFRKMSWIAVSIRLTRASIHGCMSTATTSISLQIINISRFLYFLTEDTILVQFQEIEKGGFQKNTEAEGTPSHSDEKSHFILKITHQIF